MNWSYVVWDMQTGDEVTTVTPLRGGTWSCGTIEDNTHRFHLGSNGLYQETAWDVFGRWSQRDRVLSVLWDDVPVYHGMLLDEPRYDPATDILEVVHTNVLELADGRWMYGIGGYDPHGEIVWSGYNKQGLLVRVLERAFLAPISGAWPIPVGVPAAQSGSLTLDVKHWQKRSAANLIRECTTGIDGRDLDLQPTRDMGTGKFGWTARIGDPYLYAPTFDAHLQAASGILTDVNYGVFGREKVTGVFGLGLGQEVDMVVGGAALPVSAGLARDTIFTDKTESDLGRLNAKTAAFLAPRAQPTVEWSFSTLTSQLRPDSLRIGTGFAVESAGNSWIPDGTHLVRVLDFSGTDAEKIKMTLETI